MAKKHLVIIGHGMAGSRLLDELLARHATSRYRITVFGEEPGAAYNRILLSKVLAGADPDAIRMKSESWNPGDDVKIISKLRVEKLDTPNRIMHLSDGSTEHYDIAILATGSKPFIPKIEGALLPDGSPKPGVFAYRTLDDCLQMRSKSRPGDSAVVLGGGLLGLEAAKALADNGLHVTVSHLMPSLMETQLDDRGGAMLQRQIEQMGIFIRCSRTIAAITGDDQVRGVKLDDGTTIAADMVVLACGIRPRVELAQASGIPVNRGVIVNDAMATQSPGVYAVGECAEHRGRVYGIVTPIWEQCETLADILCATKSNRRYTGSKLYTRLKVAGIDVASLGVVKPELSTDQTVQIFEEHRSSYRKLIIREGKLIGAQLVGDTTAVGQLTHYFDKSSPLPANPLEILCSFSASSGNNPVDRQVCNCNNVTESVIIESIKNGCQSIEAIGACTKAGTGCGSCKTQIAALLRTHLVQVTTST